MSIVTQFVLFISLVIIVFTVVAISSTLQQLSQLLNSYIELQVKIMIARLERGSKNGEKKED